MIIAPSAARHYMVDHRFRHEANAPSSSASAATEVGILEVHEVAIVEAAKLANSRRSTARHAPETS